MDVFGQHTAPCAPVTLVRRTRPRRSVADMLSPPGPWRRLSSPLDVIATPLYESRRIPVCVWEFTTLRVAY